MDGKELTVSWNYMVAQCSTLYCTIYRLIGIAAYFFSFGFELLQAFVHMISRDKITTLCPPKAEMLKELKSQFLHGLHNLLAVA